MVLRNLGVLARDRGELDVAEAALLDAQATVAEVGDMRAAAYADRNLAALYARRHEYTTAISRLESANAALVQVGDRRSSAGATDELGTVYMLAGNRAKASAAFRRSSEMFEVLGDRRSAAKSRYRFALANASTRRGPMLLQEALFVLQQLGIKEPANLEDWMTE